MAIAIMTATLKEKNNIQTREKQMSKSSRDGRRKVQRPNLSFKLPFKTRTLQWHRQTRGEEKIISTKRTITMGIKQIMPWKDIERPE